MKPWTRRQPRRKTTPTLAEALARYLEEVSPTKRAIAQERSIARKWLSTSLANRELGSIRNTDLNRLRDEWLLELKPATVVRRLAMLSHLYTVVRKDWGYSMLANPVQLVRRPTVDDARDRRFFDSIRLRGVTEDECPREELAWIVESTESPELPAILTLAAETGMRRSEVAGIRREHVNLLHGYVHLPHSKNGHARDVPLTPVAKEVLRQHLAGRPLRGAIFAMKAGSITQAFIRARLRARRRYEALCQKHGRRPNPAYFRDLRFHDTRHEGTSQLATVLAMHELAKANGNRDTRMLLRYFHPDPAQLARKLARSPLGRRQLQRIREGRLSGVRSRYASAPASQSGAAGRVDALGNDGLAGQSRRAWI
ncbi:tyrosine-type recombinase/integrase [Achromobacter insuavis]|uniref:tyrosine-type recombinase/integrase n=1 Tax=Achromobacter insuavis TaxID=1287735 RepID=UPI001F13EA30|nr:tyrosine-type recombinase/integrase [Achromobacter insuavis]